MKTYRSNGKLLLTAEYAVLDGATALALPTLYGQNLSVKQTEQPNTILWTSFDETNTIWYKGKFEFNKANQIFTALQNDAVSQRLVQIFKAIQILNPVFFENGLGYDISTTQDFNRHWGLGTSSTLINNLTNWARIDAYELLGLTFGGSGYDIACAQHDTPIYYKLITGEKPLVETIDFNPIFKEHLHFVYLNQKQDSRDSISHYRNKGNLKQSIIGELDVISRNIVKTTSLSEFTNLIDHHENIISHLLERKTIKATFFSDFEGSIKSLGAWGGDFILVASENNPKTYFAEKGFQTIIPYQKMVK